MDRIDRIVGGAESACVLAMMDALGAVLNETGDQKTRLIAVAKASLQESMGRRVNLERPGCRSHLDQMVETIEALGPAQEAGQLAEPAPIDVDALLNLNLDDIDLDDESHYTPANELEAHLSAVGEDMARRYSLSKQTFWMERTSFKGQHFLGIGTSSGPHPRFPGQDFNIFCTTQGYRTIKDVDAELVFHANGRQLTKGEDRDGRSYFIRFAPIATERTWRFWASTNKDGRRQDVEGLKFAIQLNADSPRGYIVTRKGGRSIQPSHSQTQV